MGDIRTIVGGFVGGGTSLPKRKACAHRERYKEVYSTSQGEEAQRTFLLGRRLWGGMYPHDNALVVTQLVTNYITRQILINSEAQPISSFGTLSSKWDWPRQAKVVAHTIERMLWRCSATFGHNHPNYHNWKGNPNCDCYDWLSRRQGPFVLQCHIGTSILKQP